MVESRNLKNSIPKGRILIIDDDPVIRSTLRDVLELDGFDITDTSNLTDSYALLKQQAFDAIFADLFLQDESGLEVIEFITHNKLEIPVVIITGKPNIESASNAVRLGAFDYLIKPASVDVIQRTAERACEKKRLIEEWKQVDKLKAEYTHKLEREVALQIVKIKENERKYKTLVEQSLVGVFIFSKGVFRYVNSKFCEIFGYNATDLIDKFEVINLLDPSEHERVYQFDKWLQTLREKSFIHEEAKGVTAQGKPIFLQIWLSRIIYDEKLAIQGIVIDISDKAKLRQQEKLLQIELLNENKLATIGELATGIAHNLNNPLSTLMGYAELLHRKYPDLEYVPKILDQTKRMTEIIKTVLRKSQREHIRDIEPLDLNEIIREEMKFLEADLEYKHQVKSNLDLVDKLPEIYGRYSDVSQSLQNIVRNALDSMYDQKQRSLIIKTDFDDDFITLSVIDSGCGMTDEIKNKLFTPFFTTKPSRGKQKKGQPVGTGLGLSSVYQLLGDYGVKFDIHSTPGIGTDFKIKFPRKAISEYNNENS